MYEKELIGLAESGARYLVIGGIAVVFHGFPRFTNDLDIMPDLSPDNLEKIISTLTSLGYRPRVPADPQDLKDPVKREMWYQEKNMRVFSFIHPQQPAISVDLMIYHPIDFEELYRRRHTVTVGGRPIEVISLEDLICLKKSVLRDKDVVDIKYLERILERRKDD